MGQFHCRVADAEGRVFSHVEPASSQEEARQKLVDRGLYVYSVESRGGRLAGLLRQRSGRQIGGSEFVILNQQFNTLIKAGLPILKSLDLLASRATAPKLRPVISQIRNRVREGKSLSEAVSDAGVFSKVYSTAILAGEKSGNLSGVLDFYRLSEGQHGCPQENPCHSCVPGFACRCSQPRRHLSGRVRGPEVWSLVSRY